MLQSFLEKPAKEVVALALELSPSPHAKDRATGPRPRDILAVRRPDPTRAACRPGPFDIPSQPPSCMLAGMCGVPSQAVELLLALGVVRRDSDENTEPGDAALDWAMFVGMVKDFTLWRKLLSLQIDGTTCRIDAARLFVVIDAQKNLLQRAGKVVEMTACSNFVWGGGTIAECDLFEAKMPVVLALVLAALNESYGTPEFKSHPTGIDVAKAAITYLNKNRPAIEVRAVSHSRASLRPQL